MRKYANLSMALLSLFVSSCTTQEPAPVEYGNELSSITSKGSKGQDTSYSSSTSGSIKSRRFDNTSYLEPEENTGSYLKDPHGTNKRAENYISEESEPFVKPIVKKPEVKNKQIMEESSLEEELHNIDDKIEKTSVKQALNKNSSDLKTKIDEFTVEKEEIIAPEPIESITPTVPVAVEGALLDRPVSGPIITKFGEMSNGVKSSGIDIVAKAGTPINAAAEGIIVHVGNDPKFGNLVIVKHNNNLFTAYAHMQTLEVAKGASIAKGQTIGLVGATGNVTKPQLHFAVREGKIPVDPMKYLKN